MIEIKDGGPAFPKTGRVSSENKRMEEGQTGMTLRDYIAAKAIVYVLQSSDVTFEEDAKTAYRIADAMLRARGAQ